VFFLIYSYKSTITGRSFSLITLIATPFLPIRPVRPMRWV